MAFTNKVLKETVSSGLMEGLTALVAGAPASARNAYGNYRINKMYEKMPGNVGYDVNGRTYREDGSVASGFDLTGAGGDKQFAIKYDSAGKPEKVVVEGNIFAGKENENPRNVIRNFLKNNIGSYATIIESGQKVYLGKDLPGEYSYSESSKKNKKSTMETKGQMAQNLTEAVEIATGREWNKNTKSKHDVDAKFGWYKYDTQFEVNGQDVSAELLIRNDANGKKYLYDVINIKVGAAPQASNQSGSAIAGSSSYHNNTTTNEGKSQYEIKYSDGEVENTPFADALAGIDTDSLFNNGENDTQHAMPVSGTEADVDAEGIIAPKEMIAQIPKANRVMMNVWSKRTGSKILVAGTKSALGQESAGAYSRSKDTIVIDWKTAMDSEAFARKILTHEGVHSVEASEFYNELKDYAFNNLYANEQAKNKAIADKIKQYGDEGVTLDDVGAEKELVADYISENILSSEKAINNFCRQNPSLAKNVYWSLKKAYSYLTDKQSFEEMKNIEKGLEIFEKALYTRAMGGTDGGMQYTFTPKVDGDIVAKAEKMESEGKDTREIWRTLKVGRGLDGQWRREIDDSGAIFSRKGDLAFAESNPDYKEYKELYDAKARNALGLEGGRVLNTIEEQRYEKLKTIWGNTFKKNGRITEDANMQDKLSAYLKHDELYKEYPHLKELTVVFDDSMEVGNWGQYNRQNKTITLNSKQSTAEMKATLLHEVMHAIQDYEGLARGSSAEYWENEKRGAERARKVLNWIKELKETSKENPDAKDILELNNILRQEYATMNMNEFIPNGEIQGEAIQKYYSDSAIKDLQDKVSYFGFNISLSGRDTYDLYKNTAGEIEASDVSKRSEMSAEQRLENFPESMAPNEDVVFADGEYAASEKIDGNGNKYWHIETGKDIFAGLKNDKDTLQKRAYQYFISNNKRFVIDGIIDGENLIFVADTGRKYVYGDHSNNLNDVEYAQKLRLLPSIYDLIEHANVSWSAPNVKSDSKSKLNKYKKDGLINYRGRVRIDNSYFNYVVRVGKSGIGKVMYEINLDADNATKVSDNNVASPTLKSTSNNYNLPQNNATVKSDFQFSSPVASADTEAESDVKIKSNKAKSYYERYSNTAKKDIGKLLGIPKSRLGVIDGNIDTLAGEYFHTGKISEESKNALFEKAWKEGVIIDDTNKEFAKALRKDLKSSTLYISSEEAQDIPDFGVWRRGQIGNMYISTKNGYPIDSKYSELSQQYPDLFPDDIIAPSDQLLRIAEVMENLKPLEYTLEEREAEFKDKYREKFKQGLNEFEKRLSDVSRYEKARELSDVQNMYGRDELTVEEANNIYAELKSARKNYEKVMAKELLAEADKKKVEQVLAGDIDVEDIKGSKFNVEGIKKAVAARAPVDLLEGVLKKHKAAVKARRFETAEKFLEGSDFWKEKKSGFSYARETMERNFYDIMGDGKSKTKTPEFTNIEKVVFGEIEEERYSDRLIDIIGQNYNKFINSENVYDVKAGDVKNIGRASDSIWEYFKSVGEEAINPELGKVELNHKGAKTTVFHGLGTDKFTATAAIKNVIENGEIIAKEENWKGRGYDTAAIVGKGVIDGKESLVGVIVKSYPKGNMNSKFYLHEAIKIEALSSNAEEQILTRVSDTAENELSSTEDSASTKSVSQNGKNVNSKDSSVDKATRLIDHYFTPVHEHEAQSIRNKNEYRQRVADLGLSQKIKKGNKTSESFAVQFLGEVESDLAMLTSRKYISEKAQGRIKELKRQREIFLRENPNLDKEYAKASRK